MFILVWMTINEVDHWQAFDDQAEAEQAYSNLIESEETYTASLCTPIRSTDYPTT
jgi:hypothetical protein